MDPDKMVRSAHAWDLIPCLKSSFTKNIIIQKWQAIIPQNSPLVNFEEHLLLLPSRQDGCFLPLLFLRGSRAVHVPPPVHLHQNHPWCCSHRATVAEKRQMVSAWSRPVWQRGSLSSQCWALAIVYKHKCDKIICMWEDGDRSGLPPHWRGWALWPIKQNAKICCSRLQVS